MEHRKPSIKWLDKIFTPATYSVGATVSLQGFSLLGFMLLVRLLSVELMGIWAIWLTLVGIADMTRQGLVRNGLVRFSLLETDKRAEWQTAGLLLNVLMSCLLSMLLLLSACVLLWSTDEPMVRALVWLAVPFSILQGIGRYAETIQVARSDFKGIFWANLINGLLQFSFLLFCFIEKRAPGFMALIAFQGIGISAGLLFTLFYRKTYFRFGALKKEHCRRLFQFGKYVAGTNFFSLLFQRLDTLLISLFLTPSAVAIYNVATRLNGLLDLPLNGVSQAIYPKMAADFAEQATVQEVYGKNVRQLLWIQTPLTLMLVIAAPVLVDLMAGSLYQQAVPLVQLLALAGLVKPWGRTFGMTLDALGMSDFNFKLLGISFAVNLTFSLLLLPAFGVVGAAAATGLGTLTSIAIGQYFLQKQLAVRPWSF